MEDVRDSGFVGWAKISALQESGCREVLDEAGVYLVLRLGTAAPDFLPAGTGPAKYPSEKVGDLQSRWVKGAVVLNIGKAGGPDIEETLRGRLKKYMRFGQGKNSGHSGGRRIWQLRDSGDLLVCWKPTAKAIPKQVETKLIRQFEQRYGKVPFANARH